MRKRGMAIVAAVVMLLTSGIFLPGQKIVHAEGLNGDGYLIAEKIEWESSNPNKDQMVSNDTFTVTVTVRNKSKEDMTVSPKDCMILWKPPVDSELYRAGFGIGEAKVLKPNETVEIKFERQIFPTEVSGTYTLSNLHICTVNEEYKIEYAFYPPESRLDGFVGGKEVHNLPYGGVLDYTVVRLGTDLEAPVILSMEAVSNIIDPSDALIYKLKLSDYGEEKPSMIWITFQDVANEKNQAEIGVDISYSDEWDCYTCLYGAPMSNNLPGGATYRVMRIELYDTNANLRAYDWVDGILKDSDGNTLKVDDFTIVESSSIQPGSTGDINGDGRINLQDLMLCLNHVGKKETLTGDSLSAADINQDGNVNLQDLMRLLNYVGKKTDTL